MPLGIEINVITENKDATEPPEDATLFRYVGLDEYLALISRKRLHFTKVSDFSDKWEGCCSRSYLQSLRPPFRKLVEACRDCTYVSCWNMQDHESMAMWRLYGQHGTNLSIKTTYGKLKASLAKERRHIYCGVVGYLLDHESEQIDLGKQCLRPFLKKRSAFRFESEVRLITRDIPFSELGAVLEDLRPKSAPAEAIKFDKTDHPRFFDLKIDLNLAIDAVLVSPDAGDWFVDVVKDVTKKYHLLPDLVCKSALNRGPSE